MDKIYKSITTLSTYTRSWWVLAFALACAILYEHGLKERDQAFQQLREHQHHLEMEKNKAITIQENLKLQINSQSDLAWIELTLMKGLGLTRENETKVFFDSH